MALEPEPALWRVGITYNDVFEIKEKELEERKKKKKWQRRGIKLAMLREGAH